MPDWDDDSPQLQENLFKLSECTGRHAKLRKPLTLAEIKSWHVDLMKGLTTDSPAYVGAFRGEPGVNVNVVVRPNPGVDKARVAHAVDQFQRFLQRRIHALDAEIAPGADPGTTALFNEVVALCAWAHAEWVRIHPFVNGNGRTARLIANCIAERYGLPPFVQLRPRPGGGYGSAGAKAMQGDWKPTVSLFHELLKQYLRDNSPS